MGFQKKIKKLHCLEAFLDKKDKGASKHSAHKYATQYIKECMNFERCILDGEFDMIQDLPIWHHVALLDIASFKEKCYLDRYKLSRESITTGGWNQVQRNI